MRIPTAQGSTDVKMKWNNIWRCLISTESDLIGQILQQQQRSPKSQWFTSTNISFLRTGLHWFPTWFLIQWIMMEEMPLSKASCSHSGEQAPRGTELSYASTIKSLTLTRLLMLYQPKQVPWPSPKPVGGMSPAKKHDKHRRTHIIVNMWSSLTHLAFHSPLPLSQ